MSASTSAAILGGAAAARPSSSCVKRSPVTSARSTFGSNREDATSSSSPLNAASVVQKASDDASASKTTSAASGEGFGPHGPLLIRILGGLGLRNLRRRLSEHRGLVGRSAGAPHSLQIEVVLLDERRQTGADEAHLHLDRGVDLGRRLLKHGVLGDEIGVPPSLQSPRRGLIEGFTVVELVHPPSSVRGAVGAVSTGRRRKRDIIVATTSPKRCRSEGQRNEGDDPAADRPPPGQSGHQRHPPGHDR